MLAADLIANLAVRRNRRGNCSHAVARQKPTDIADTPDIGVAVFLGKPEPLREIGPHLVAVEHLDIMAAAAQFRRCHCRQRRFACARQAREPERKALFHRMVSAAFDNRLLIRWSKLYILISASKAILGNFCEFAMPCFCSNFNRLTM